MSWKNSIILGVLVGSTLGLVTYSTLSRIGTEAMLQSVYVPQTLHTERGCGLEPVTACYSLAYIYYAGLVTPDNVKMQPLDAVVNNGGMQPFAPAQEDELRAMDAVQYTYHPQVTRHGYFVQQTGNSGRLQGTAISGSW